MANPLGTPNEMIFQAFEWYLETWRDPGSGDESIVPCYYRHLTGLLPTLAFLGITSIWLPPGCKAMHYKSNGYDVYDIFDLGEHDQKGRIHTKWGSRRALDNLIEKAKKSGIELIWDAVLSHKAGADSAEEVWAVEVDDKDRRREICPPKKIEAWLRFNFPGREQAGMPGSQMKWNQEHFNGTDWDQREQKKAIFKLISDPSTHPLPAPESKGTLTRSTLTPKRRPLSWLRKLSPLKAVKNAGSSSQDPPRRPGKGWSDDVDKEENGNADFLMFSNIDYSHPQVRKETINWGAWMVEDIGIDGFRLDAVQHISYSFVREWIGQVAAARQKKTGKRAFIVGEVWTGEVGRIIKWLDAVRQPPGRALVYAFDAPLIYNFSHLCEDIAKDAVSTHTSRKTPSPKSPQKKTPDLRTLLNNSLVAARPNQSVTLVTNHDTQPGQAMDTLMSIELKPLFYAFILLRQEGLPCVFRGDLFGTQGPHAEPPVGVSQAVAENRQTGRRSLLAELMMCRKLFAYGSQKDYCDSPHCIGWTRAGQGSESGCAVVLRIERSTNGLGEDPQFKRMQIGQPGELWYDILGHVTGDIRIDAKGYGAFAARSSSVSVFVRKDAAGVENFPVLLDSDLI